MGLTVLIINETPSFCDLMTALVKQGGHFPSCVTGVREAQDLSRGLSPDVVILELSRPGIGDMGTIHRLQRVEAMRHVPLIVVSDFPELEFELLHVFDFLTKPVDVRRLLDNLATISRGGKRAVLTAMPEPLSPGDYRLFYDFLVTNSGLHFEQRNQKILERGLKSRMSALKSPSYREYYDYLVEHREDRQELQKLLQHLTIGETYFFRYTAHFDALRKNLPGLLARKGKGLRLWSAGCSTGEEPYSMAMTVMEEVPDWRERDIRILATDINNRALRRGRDGVYKQWSMRVIEERYVDRYFDRVGESFLVKDEVKEMVDFSHLNLQTAELPSPEGTFREIDVLFCRNVMIYFSLPTTRKIVEKFAHSIVPGGFLFLGHAETLAHVSTQFERVAHSSGFYYRNRGAQAKVEPRPVRERRPEPQVISKTQPPRPAEPKEALRPALRSLQVPPPAPLPDFDEMFRKAQLLYDEEKYEEAGLLLGELLGREPEHQGALVTSGFLLANRGRFKEALAVCSGVIALNDLLPEAYFLRGLIFDAMEKTPEAVEEYRKAILLRMDFVMAHYNLGRLLFRIGKEREGVRELKNSMKLLEREKDEVVIPHSGGLSREAFLEQLANELRQVA
jgi:chemotaxis protein methyltransferase CheR